MRIGRTEQWLLLAVLLAGAGWVGMLVYARLSQELGAAEVDAGSSTSTGTGTSTATKAAADAAPATGAPSEMVFSEEEVVPPVPPPTSTGPATAAAGLTTPILIESQPSGARVMDDGNVLGRTPISFPRPGPEGRYLLVQKTGYRSVRIALTPTTRGRIEVTLRPLE